MAIELAPGKRLALQIQPVDAAGNPAPVEAGSVAWGVTDPAILSVTVDAGDETKAIVRRVGPNGVANVQVAADADLGSGVATLTAEAEVSVVSGMAVSLGLSTSVEDDV